MDGSDIHAVSVAVLSNSRFLLVRRGRAPSKGLFAFPGGRVEQGEDAEAAIRRELLEETGLSAGELSLFREIAVDGESGRRYRLEVFRAAMVEGMLRAGDDADHAGWYTLEEMRSLPVTASTMEIVEAILATCETS